MGCSSSKISPRIRQITSIQHATEKEVQLHLSLTARKKNTEVLHEDFRQLREECHRVFKTSDAVIACSFGPYSYPAVVSPLCLKTGDQIGITMPIISFTHQSQVQIIAIGDIATLSGIPTKSYTSNLFFENCIQWISSTHKGNFYLLAFDITFEISDALKTRLDDIGYQIKFSSDLEQLLAAPCILVESSCKYEEKIHSAILNGAGLIVVASKPETPNRFYLNNLLSHYGLGFVETFFVFAPAFSSSIKIHSHNAAKFCTLEAYAQDVLSNLENDIIQYDNLDKAITALKYCITQMHRGENFILDDLLQIAIDRFDVFKGSSMIFNDHLSKMLMTLIIALDDKLPAEHFEGRDWSESFPGPVKINNYITKSVHFDQIQNGWNCTGLYAPPGVIISVTSDSSEHPFHIQIGSHVDNLTSKLSWCRCPSVCSMFFGIQTITIASPYGGPIYLISDCFRNEQFTLTFTNVLEYSVYRGNYENWPPNCTVPIFEIEIQSLTVTFLSSSDYDLCLEKVEPIFSKLIFIATNAVNGTGARLVFDVADDISYGYPIVFPVTKIPDIFTRDPNPHLFMLIAYVAISQLPLNLFGVNEELLLGAVVAGSAFSACWPKCSHFHLCQLEIKEEEYNLLLPTTKYFQLALSMISPNSKDPWYSFIQLLGEMSKTDLSALLRRKIKMKESTFMNRDSSASLQEYMI